jgi:outer membrane protein TolC
MNKYLLIFFYAFTFFTANAQLNYSLEDIIIKARGQSPRAKQAETRRENRFWQYKYYRSNYNPQLRLQGNTPGYNRDYNQNRLDDGSIIFQEQEQTFTYANLSLQQPIALSGGQISVNSDVYRWKNIPADLRSWNSTVVNIRLDQPLFGFNILKWDRMTEPLRYEESKRAYVEEMEFISSLAVDLFFDYLDAQIGFDIANFNLSRNDTIYNIEQGRYNIGTSSRDKLLQVELQLLRSKQQLTQAKLDLQTSELEMKTFIGINDDIVFDLIIPDQLTTLDVNIEEALAHASANRSDFISFERRRLEANKQVAQAKSDRYQLNMTASYGLTGTGIDLGTSYEQPNSQQRLNVQFNIPIIDWGRNKTRMKTALANKKLEDYIIAQDEQTFLREIISLVSQFEVLKSQIEISQKSDLVAQERYNVSQNQYLIGKIDITNLNIALTEKDEAKRSYLAALRSYWKAYFELRRLTLYDFANKELLYTLE